MRHCRSPGLRIYNIDVRRSAAMRRANVSSDLSGLREQIDRIDGELIQLLAQRARMTAAVGEHKSAHGLPLYVPERETELLAARREAAAEDRKSVVWGKRVSVRVDLGGRRNVKKKKQQS